MRGAPCPPTANADMSVDVNVNNKYSGAVNFVVVYEGATGTTITSPTVVAGKTTGSFTGLTPVDGRVTVIVRAGEEDCSDRILYNRTFAGKDTVDVTVSGNGVVTAVATGLLLTAFAVGLGVLMYMAFRPGRVKYVEAPPSRFGNMEQTQAGAIPESRFST